MGKREQIIKKLEDYEPYAACFSHLTVESGLLLDVLQFLREQQQIDLDTGDQPSINEPDQTQRKEDDLARYQYLLMESHNMVDELLRNVGNSPCPRCSHYYAPDNNLLGTLLCDKYKTITWDSQCPGFDEVKSDG